MPKEKINSQQEFDSYIKEGTTFVDFYADWCGPCKSMQPILKEVYSKFDGKIKFGEVDTEAHPEIAQRYNVTSLPRYIIFSRGEIIQQINGAMPKANLEGRISKILSEN